MNIEGINFPDRLLNAIRDKNLVIFAGAGVSMGEPASLPDFTCLASKIAEGTGMEQQDNEQTDRFLGRINDQGVNVHQLAKDILATEGLTATELHHNLLRLYDDATDVRIVTTNFDLLFEQAAKTVFNEHKQPEVFRAPALPPGHRFNGIVHLHGSVKQSNEMVLIDKDFGRAYLDEGWALRFLADLFKNFTVFFVGYRHEDVILTYLSRAISGTEAIERFALAKQADIEHWSRLGIKPIPYPQSSPDDHCALHKGIRRLSEHVRRNLLDWQHEIKAIAGSPPPIDEEINDLIDYALKDPRNIKFFSTIASDPEWIDWLYSRGYLTGLFKSSESGEQDQYLAIWLVKTFAVNDSDKLFRLIADQKMRLDPNFWFCICQQIGSDAEVSRDNDVFSHWISVLIATFDNRLAHTNPLMSSSLVNLAQQCISKGSFKDALQIVDLLATSVLSFKPGLTFCAVYEKRPGVNPEMEMIGGGNDDSLNVLWSNSLKSQLFEIAEPLLELAEKHIFERHRALQPWKTDESLGRNTIEDEENAQYHREIDTLINIARDCLEWLALNQKGAVSWWCDRFVHTEVPVLRRLAVHGLYQRQDLSEDDKMGWLFENLEQHDFVFFHEVNRLVKQVYPRVSIGYRESLIEKVRSYHLSDNGDSGGDNETANLHFLWFRDLHKSDPQCRMAQQARDDVLAEYPDLRPQEDSNQSVSSIEFSKRSSRWSANELISKPVAKWLNELVSYQDAGPLGFSPQALNKEISKAIKQNFDWSIDLAQELATAGCWNSKNIVWPVLIETWSEMELEEENYRKTLRWFDENRLYPAFSTEISNALLKLVKDRKPDYLFDVLPQANKIATSLWGNLDDNDPLPQESDWLLKAINHPAGKLTEFWLWGLSSWKRQQEQKPISLNCEYQNAFSNIVKGQRLPDMFGRTVLASQFAFLWAAEEEWTRENLLPYFEDDDPDCFKAAWDGFLAHKPLISPLPIIEGLNEVSIKALQRLSDCNYEKLNNFIAYYTNMLTYSVPEPLEKGIPEIFRCGNQKVVYYFLTSLHSFLSNSNENARQELWQRWLKRYWQYRLNGVPPPSLDTGEMWRMLGWLPCLAPVFPEAVDMAVQMPFSASDIEVSGNIVYEINKSDLPQQDPENTAKLLIYLGNCNLPSYIWYSGQELIGKLLNYDISQESAQKLKELNATL